MRQKPPLHNAERKTESGEKPNPIYTQKTHGALITYISIMDVTNRLHRRRSDPRGWKHFWLTCPTPAFTDDKRGKIPRSFFSFLSFPCPLPQMWKGKYYSSYDDSRLGSSVLWFASIRVSISEDIYIYLLAHNCDQNLKHSQKTTKIFNKQALGRGHFNRKRACEGGRAEWEPDSSKAYSRGALPSLKTTFGF